MTIDRKVNSLESSFRMEGMDFDSECIERVKGILSGEILVSDAITSRNYLCFKKKVLVQP